MDDGARTDEARLRELRGVGGLRGVRPRRVGRGAGGRPSAGRGPTDPARWERGAAAPLAVDRVERVQLEGLETSLPCRLFAAASRDPLPVIVAWGSGGTTQRDLDADDAWARDLADRTGAIVMLCGARRDAGELACADGASAYADIARHALAWGGHPFQLAVAGRGIGLRLAQRVAEEATAWPEVATPHACIVGMPLEAAAGVARDLFTLPAPPRPAHPLRRGAEVRTLDGLRLGTVGAVRGADFRVRRGPGHDDLQVPLRAVVVESRSSAVVLDVTSGEIGSRAWGAGIRGRTPRPDARHN